MHAQQTNLILIAKGHLRITAWDRLRGALIIRRRLYVCMRRRIRSICEISTYTNHCFLECVGILEQVTQARTRGNIYEYLKRKTYA